MKLNFKRSIYFKDFILVLQGIAMGAANKVPGVSGGVVALVAGFYETLIFSFQRFNVKALKLVLNRRFKSFWRYVNGRFLTLLFTGVVISYFSVSLLLDYLLSNHETLVLGSFFGMIIGSLYLVFIRVKIWKISSRVLFVLGLIFGLSISYLRPVAENDQLYFVFFCGIISISNFILTRIIQ